MIHSVKLDEVIKAAGPRTGYQLLKEEQGCVNGCNCGVSIYRNDEYVINPNNYHEDQEGFFVLEGYGKALVGDEEISLEPGVCFMIPCHTVHAMKKDVSCEYCKVFWFHAAV